MGPSHEIWHALRLRMVERPPDMEGTREYIENRSRGQPIRGGPPAFGGRVDNSLL
jgi:hypothetical protein